MLLFLLSFYLHCDLLSSEEINIVKFDESFLIDKHYQNLRKAKSLIRDLDLEQRFKATSMVLVDKRHEDLVSHYRSTKLLGSRKAKDNQKLQIAKAHKKPQAKFLHSPQNYPYDPSLNLSPIYPGTHAPPSITKSSFPNSIQYGHPLSLRNSIFPDLMPPRSLFSVNRPGRYIASFSKSPSSTRKTPKRPSVTAQSTFPHPIPTGQLLSQRDSIFPDQMEAGNLLSVNGPGRYIASFSKSPSSTRKTSKRPSVTAQSTFPHPIPTGQLLSPRNSIFPDQMEAGNLLSVNGPGPYISLFSDAPSFTTTKSKRSSVLAQSSSPDPIPPVTLKHSELRSSLAYPRQRLNPRNSIYPEPVFPWALLSAYGPGYYISTVSYSPKFRKTTSKKPQVSYNKASHRVHFDDENPHELKTFIPAITSSISNHARSSKSRRRLTIPSRTMNMNSKTWLGEIAHKILKVSKDHTALSQRRGTSTVPAPPRMAQTRQQTVIDEGEDEFFYVTLPGTTSEDPNKELKSTIAGDVLHGKIQVQVPTTLWQKRLIAYKDEMNLLNEGYMMYFFIKMCRLIARKSRSEVLQTLHHTEMIFNKMRESDQLNWIGEPLESVIRNILMVPSGQFTATETQTRAAMMSRMLSERTNVLSAEVNFIIDHAEMFYEDEDGERLLHALEEFTDYPNTNRTSYQICNALMENLLLPFRESNSPRRQQLVDTINKALQERFPDLLSGPRGETVTAGKSPIAIQEPRKRMRIQKRKGPLKYLPPNQPVFRSITTERYTMNRRSTPAFLPRDYELRTHRVLRARYQRKQ